MNKHIMMDRLSIGIGSLYGDKIKFFREGLKSEALTEMPRALEMEFTNPTREGEYRIPVGYGAQEGTARYSLLNWAGEDRPSLIFHHGSGETNYTARLRKILPRSIQSQINILAVSIPHNRNMKEYLHGIGSLERFAFLLSSSVRLTEYLGLWLRDQGKGKIVASGISLGGWITNLHFSLYGSLDEYRPIFAGAAVEHLFTDTIYRKLASSEARNNPEVLRQTLNFEEPFQARNCRKVFPLMARYDQYIQLERQGGIYPESQVRIVDKGHITGAMDVNTLKDHLLQGLGIHHE